MEKHFYTIYLLLTVIFGVLAYDLFNAKNECDEAILEWSGAEIRGYPKEQIKDLEAVARSVCGVLEVKAKVYSGD